MLNITSSFLHLATLLFVVVSLFVWPKDVGPVGHGSPAASRRLWVRSLVGTNFRLQVKKKPSPASCPKHCGARPNSQGDGPLCTGGAGVRGFSWPAVRRSFYLSKKMPWGRSYPPQVKFFKDLSAQSSKMLI